MRVVVQYTSWLVGVPLEILIIAALLRGPYRRYPLLLLYSITLFLTTVIEVSVNQAYFAGIHFGYSRATYYWVDEGIRQGLLFAVVLSLAYLATDQLRSRNLVRAALITGGIALAVISFVFHHEIEHISGAGKWRWMTLWVRDISFASAILDLAVWALLLTYRSGNTQLLLLSGALGINFTGEAIGESLRYLFRRMTFTPGDLIEIVTSLAALWIWWQALRPVAIAPPAGAVIPPPRNGTGV
jgi:hypothetical protein